MYAATLAINVAVNAIVRAETGSEAFAFLTATGITTVLNYLGLRFLAFRAAARRIA